MADTPAEDGYQEALRRIAEAKRTEAKELSLSGLDLTALPPEIGDLPALQRLYLHNNQLATLPNEFGNLTALQALWLNNNQLATLPNEFGKLTALQMLDLDGNQLTTLPPEIGDLTDLQALDLRSNQLATLPNEFGNLTALQTLWLNDNQLATLPNEFGNLTALQMLDLDGNQLATLPNEIGSLTALQELYLSNNQLATLPNEFGNLTALQTLNLQGNQLATLPNEIGNLTALRTLWLSGNRLTTLPNKFGKLKELRELALQKNQLTMLPPEIADCGALQELYLHENDALQIPESVLGPSRQDVHGLETVRPHAARPTDILNFYFSRHAAAATGTLRAVNELKVMLVGRGGAGKTSLRRFFLGQAHDPDEQETQGIALDKFPLRCDGMEVAVHLWDFAGQEITHALHQFFLTEGCIYILVLDPRSNTEMTDAFYWLDQLARYAPASPVLVSLNRQDARQGGYDVDRDLLAERYPQIRGFVKTNCASRDGCDALKAELTREVERLDSDEPPRLQVPANWLEVENACWHMAGRRVMVRRRGVVANLIDKIFSAPAEATPRRHTLTFEEFQEVCSLHGLQDLEGQESLARLLHKLGAVLHFVDDPRLRDTSVLNPHWVTDGVYRLLRCKDRPGSNGILSIEEAAEALVDPSDESARYLLGLMERFEMCFPLDEDTSSPTRWLIPGALDPYQPQGLGRQWHDPGAIRMRYDYHAPVAEGILPRFIVLTYPLKGEAVWRNGVVLRDDAAAALIRRGENINHIEVAAFGPEAPRLRLLELIQGMMDRVNADLPGKPPTVEQEIQERPGTYRSVAELKAAEAAGKEIIIATDPPPPAFVEPTPELDLSSERASRDGSRQPVRTFLSYSHADRSAKNIFATNLAVMKQKGYITPWHDGMIEPGKKWKEEIESELESMDLFIGLLTTSFLASDFIREVELKAARRRLRQRGVREFLFVLVVVDDISFRGLDFAEYQLLKPGDKAVCEHKSRKHGFDRAQEEIERLIEHHGLRPRESGRGTRPPRAPSPGGTSEGPHIATVIVKGDYIAKGGKHVRDDHRINIGGNVVRSQVGQTLTDCKNTINQQAPGEKKDLLKELRDQVEALIKALPDDKAEEAPQVADNLEMLLKQATSAKPNRKWYSVSAEGLLEASQWTKDFTGNLVGTIRKIGKLLWPDDELPSAG